MTSYGDKLLLRRPKSALPVLQRPPAVDSQQVHPPCLTTGGRWAGGAQFWRLQVRLPHGQAVCASQITSKFEESVRPHEIARIDASRPVTCPIDRPCPRATRAPRNLLDGTSCMSCRSSTTRGAPSDSWSLVRYWICRASVDHSFVRRYKHFDVAIDGSDISERPLDYTRHSPGGLVARPT